MVAVTALPPVVVVFFGLFLEVHAESAKCSAPDPDKFPLRWKDKRAAYDCMPDEEKRQDPYRFEYYCMEPNCFILYEHQATDYQWDATCRKCVPCTADACAPPNLDTGAKYPCEKTKEGCTTETPVDCGEHGANANSYSCNCDPGWKNNVRAGTFCDVVELTGAPTFQPDPEATAKQENTNSIVIIVFVVVTVLLLALCSCCLAYFCKKRKENREVLQYIRQQQYPQKGVRPICPGKDGPARQPHRKVVPTSPSVSGKNLTPAGEPVRSTEYFAWRHKVRCFWLDQRKQCHEKENHPSSFISNLCFEKAI